MNHETKEELEKLLERRKNYFLLEGIKRKIYLFEFEKIQKRIMHLKLCFDMYHDELDILEVRFNYMNELDKLEICETAEKNLQIRWLKKSYNPKNGEAVYVAIASGTLTSEWLKELFEMQKLKRDGLIECPWPTNLETEGTE